MQGGDTGPPAPAAGSGGAERRPKPKKAGYVVTPFVVVIDTREQREWHFLGIASDARAGGGPLTVQLVRRGLKSGDYSLEGHESRVAVERKSVEDFVGTLTQRRKRFVRTMGRLDRLAAALVVVEGGWDAVQAFVDERNARTAADRLQRGLPESRGLSLRSLVATVAAWQQRFRGVGWMFAPDRRFAEAYCFRFLERWWRDNMNATSGSGDAANEHGRRHGRQDEE